MSKISLAKKLERAIQFEMAAHEQAGRWAQMGKGKRTLCLDYELYKEICKGTDEMWESG